MNHWWVIPVAIVYGLQGWLSKSVNEHGAMSWRVLWMWLLSTMGLWPIVAVYSKRLMFDALLYDIIMVMALYGAMVAAGAAQRFTIFQWAGLVVALLGCLMVRSG